jgi:hypothetical protein
MLLKENLPRHAGGHRSGPGLRSWRHRGLIRGRSAHRAGEWDHPPLPPKCPALNAMANIWQFMPENWLSNRVFLNHDDIVDHCCHAWNRLISQPWRINSVALPKWVRGYQTVGIGIT